MTEKPYRLRLIDRLRKRAAWRFYPRSDGDVVLIGPECFADLDATVICWQGENYYREAGEDDVTTLAKALFSVGLTSIGPDDLDNRQIASRLLSDGHVQVRS